MKYLKYNFFLLGSLTLILTYLSKELLGLDALLHDYLVEIFSQNKIDRIFETRKKWSWLKYLMILIFLCLKILIIAAVLDVGCFFYEKKVKFKKLFHIVVKAEFVFLLAIIFKTIWFYFFQTNYKLEDLHNFYPLSALNIIGLEGLQPWFIYPFQVLNLFELTYCLILAYSISKAIDENIEKGFYIVGSSYGVGLLIWVIGVMFFTLNMS